ncbi:MAG TPA: S46 family peptidase, partial [Bacteroidia bacterium]|nr:S46 family peptidase [Bacteroidia bacterium]
MKKLLVWCMFYIGVLNVYAEEGMWLPIMLKQMEAQMQNRGLKISAEAIYDVNNTSLKDAVVLFGGGCTGEIISKQGLLLTNHHCGFGAIAGLSTIENDYLKNGYWAYNQTQELPAPGLTATFIIRIEDVTAQIAPYLTQGMTEAERNSKIKSLAAAIESKAIAGTHYEASVKPFYSGNDFILFVSETFKDLRLVGAPPNAIGNFGEETDNWIWPRHTGDFSLFRIYAGPDNKPAAYNKNNVPFLPRKHLQISTAGITENDFTMVYGFPG